MYTFKADPSLSFEVRVQKCANALINKFSDTRQVPKNAFLGYTANHFSVIAPDTHDNFRAQVARAIISVGYGMEDISFQAKQVKPISQVPELQQEFMLGSSESDTKGLVKFMDALGEMRSAKPGVTLRITIMEAK